MTTTSFLHHHPYALYATAFGIALFISAVVTPIMRLIATKFDIMDCPHSAIKTHRQPTPYLGGVAIFAGLITSLFAMRFFTNFPTGTLHNLRSIIIGSTIMLGLGLIDDIKTKGLGFKKKFLIQILAAMVVVWFDIRLHFITPYLIAFALSIVWIVGVTNAFNIIDIMDGLSSGVACIAALAFMLISMPSEMIYVNFCAAALAGACMGFIPYNLSKKMKIFMGDTGSLTIGFVCASLALGTSYTRLNDIGLIAPLFILAIPIYDTLLVSVLRLQKGQSPFLGSKDHFALRLEFMGYSRKQILVIIYAASALLALSAYLITVATVNEAIMICAVTAALSWFITTRIAKVEIH